MGDWEHMLVVTIRAKKATKRDIRVIFPDSRVFLGLEAGSNYGIRAKINTFICSYEPHD